MLDLPENNFGFEESDFKQVVFNVGKWLEILIVDSPETGENVKRVDSKCASSCVIVAWFSVSFKFLVWST